MIKICSLVGILMMCLSGSLWADSVQQSDVIAAFGATNNSISNNYTAFESNNVLKSEYLAASLFDAAGLALWSRHRLAAEADFSAAISELRLVASDLTPKTAPSMPDPGSLGMLTCSGLLLFGAMKRKFSR
jgi:hypothetical protein